VLAVQISKLATDLKGLGDKTVDDTRVVKKFLRVVPPRYNQVAVTIEMFCDLKELYMEELVGRLRAAEDLFEPTVESGTDKSGHLLLTEEEWATRNKSRMVSSDSTSWRGCGHQGKKDKSNARGGWSSKQNCDGHDAGAGSSSAGAPQKEGTMS
jgi:hypothetical protein